MSKQIIETTLLIVSSENIEGLLTLKHATKYKVGLIESIDFKTFCAINKQSSNYDNRYVILSETESILDPYIERFTNKKITITDKRIIRGSGNYINLVYTGNDSTIEKITPSQLGQIFPDDESLDEYRELLKSFAKENEQAFYEVDQIKEDSKEYQSKKIDNKPNSQRGMEIYEGLKNELERIKKR